MIKTLTTDEKGGLLKNFSLMESAQANQSIRLQRLKHLYDEKSNQINDETTTLLALFNKQKKENFSDQNIKNLNGYKEYKNFIDQLPLNLEK